MDQAERKLFAQRERERTRREAAEQRECFRKHVLETPYEAEDPVAKWRREADEQDARFAAERRRVQDEERRRLEDQERRAAQSAVAGMQDELAEALAGIADALGVLDARLQKLESRAAKKKTARSSRPSPLPDLGPTRSPQDPSVRYTQPRIHQNH
jgi:hypothetical protein